MVSAVGRHVSTQQIVRYFAYDHLAEPMRSVSASFAGQVDVLLEQLPDSPELTVALRKLLESKDAAVRASLDL